MSDIELMPSASPKRAIPIGRPIAMTDPNAMSRMRTATTSPITSPSPVARRLEREEQVAAELHLQHRARIEVRAERLEVLQVCSDRAPRAPGTGRGSGQPDRRRRSAGCRRRARGAAPRRPSAPAPAHRARRLTRRRPSSIAWRQHHLGREAGPVRPGVGEQVGGLLRVEPRRSERVLELLAERARRAEDEHRHDEPGTDDGPRAPRRQAAQPVQSMGHDGVLLR